MTEKVLSQLQKEYKEFFLNKLTLFGVKSPSKLSKEKKSEFFTSIKYEWSKIKLAKKQAKVPRSYSPRIVSVNLPPIVEEEEQNGYVTKVPKTEQSTIHQDPPKQIIKSQSNAEQTDFLKIQYTPNAYFEQGKEYCYPVVKMPNNNSSLKLPRLGRSNQKGYKEQDFFTQLKYHTTDLELSDNVHMVIPNFNMPYEPDIVIFDKKRNLYLDIEIDEPYDGYYRYPTHNIKSEGGQKKDDTRDLFFTESGWIVIRFTEKQVHQQSNQCIKYIRNVINSIDSQNFNTTLPCEPENQWDENQCIQWQKINYRERYLGIDQFKKQYSHKEIQIDLDENEPIENVIQRTKIFTNETTNSEVSFDEVEHAYFPPKNETGNAEFISVTTLIERFFPFDLKRYVEKKAAEENRTEEDVLIEHLMIRDEASEKGTYLHFQIENYLKGKEFNTDFEEFDLFAKFHDSQIQPRNLEFADAEKRIVSHEYNVAGTIDCLFRKKDKDEYVMLDWKRSTKLVIDGRPKKYGYGYALSELNQLDNSSYYRYCLQQNIYKYIIEKENRMNISSMKLVVLHHKYSTFHVVDVPIMIKEAKIILNSLKHKI